MSYTCFDVSLENKIAHVRLKRPEAYNSMIPEFWSELPEIVRTIDDAGEARAIVLSSTGKHFTAGMDLAVFTSPGSSANDRSGELGRRRANLRRDVLRRSDGMLRIAARHIFLEQTVLLAPNLSNFF